MMKTRIISHSVACAATLLLAAACSKSEGVEATGEVTFTTEITRAAEVQSALGDGARMNVWLARTSAGSEAAWYSALCTGSVWKGSPSPIRLDTDDDRYLLAIWPYDDEARDAMHYPVSIDRQTDILYSGPGTAVSRSKPSARLTLKHALAVFAFDVESLAGGTLEQIVLGGANFATRGELRVTSGKITATATGSYTHACNLPLTAGGSTAGQLSCFVIPFASLGDETVTLRIDGREYTCKLPARSFDGNVKYVLHLRHTDAGVTLLDEIGAISLDEAAGDFETGSYGRLQLTQFGDTFALPAVTGPGSLYGSVYWGDGASEGYGPGKSHTYETAGEHRLVLDLWGAEGVSFESLEGVAEIDLSGF